jgi:hypothetical protein
VVYNDIGGHEIQKLGKYERRMYAAPQFEETYREFFKTFSGHILFIDIPRIDENTFYYNYMLSCKVIHANHDNYINAFVLDCRK